MLLTRNNVNVSGKGSRAMMFAHGFGCDQNMWAVVAPAFEEDFGSSCSTMSARADPTSAAYDPAKYSTLDGYADDVIQIGHELDLKMRSSSAIR